MGFYGNSYYYTAETFARIVLHNAGLNKTNFPTFSSSKIDIEAQHRDAGLDVTTGNRWIGLVPETQGFSIFHNKPNDSAKTFIQPFSIMSSAPNDKGKVVKTLDFGKYLNVPQIYYDEAGHISKIGDTAIFQMPSNPVKPLEERMNKIDGLDTEGKVSEPPEGSLKTQLIKKMNDTLKDVQDIQTDINNTKDAIDKNLAEYSQAISNAAAALAAANEAKTLAAQAQSTSTIYNSSIADLIKRVEALENK